jgi:hypothetical protein
MVLLLFKQAALRRSVVLIRRSPMAARSKGRRLDTRYGLHQRAHCLTLCRVWFLFPSISGLDIGVKYMFLMLGVALMMTWQSMGKSFLRFTRNTTVF